MPLALYRCRLATAATLLSAALNPAVKSSKLTLIVALAPLAAVYFGSLSTLDSAFVAKSLLVVLPVQVGACVYFVYRYWSGRLLR